MIPHRIEISGFLSYKEKQEVRFAGAQLWMLAGANGSGKSSIFDALTYALFGSHRGGSQNASELINKESGSLAVEFDFTLDRQLYRIKRTLRRSNRGTVAGTQQILREVSNGDFEPVPDTGRKVAFDKWIEDRIGLTYDTFTSSVLLLQGKAEKLLDARPSGRAEVLAIILNLAKYQALHARANERKLRLKSELEALSHQASAVPEISDLEYADALLKIDACEDVRQEAQATINALTATETQARRWAETQTRLASARQKLIAAESVLGDAVKIEKAFARLTELRGVLPAANAVITMQGQIKDSHRKTEQFAKARDDAQTRKSQAEHSLEQARQKKASVKGQLETDEGKQAKVNARLRELQGLLEKVRFAEQQESELTRLRDELARLPKDPESDARAAKDEADRLTELHRVLPILERFQTERFELAAAHRIEKEAKADLERIQHDGEQRKTEAANIQTDVERARQARANADQQVAVTRTLAEQARAAADEFATLAGARNCRACGQPLTKKHFADEKAKRESELHAAEASFRDASSAQKSAAEVESDLVAADSAQRNRLEELRGAYKEAASHVKQAGSDIKRLADSLALRHAELPESHRVRIARTPPDDWTTTSFPERDELIALRREAAGLPAARQRLHDAQDVLGKWNQFRARIDSVQQTLTKLKAELPAQDLVALRREHQALHAEEVALLHSIKGTKQNLIGFETEIDKLGREAHEAVQHLIDLAGKFANEETVRKMCDDTSDRALRELPDAWRLPVLSAGLSEYSVWRAEADELNAERIDEKYKHLELARGGLSSLRQEIDDLQAETDAYPPESRRPSDVMKQLLAEARASFNLRDEELQAARQQKAIFDGHREQRAKLGELYKRTDAEHNRYKLLSELLGRDRLQRHLVRRAERQIVDYANAVLDRLSGGQLFLKLVGADDGADKALDLECYNRVAGGSPINVAFLSGSQKFRVAVSLALAIGQYASRQHRPIESVIIDEGFGCLDRQGRQVMIQELQNLRGHLHCILLVSHQEEFADAFPDGYRFELQDGATKVSRFVR